MGIGFFITGTDTNIGKTYVTTKLVASLHNKGIDAIPYKPIQSGTINIDNRLIGEDVAFYKESLRLKEDFCYYNTYTLNTPVSPHLASKLENVSLDESIILQKYCELEKNHEVVFVEGAGGVAVPLKDDFDTVDLIKLLNLPVIIVTTLKLGTLNHTVLTVEYLKSRQIKIQGLVINKVPKKLNTMEKDNLSMIQKLTGQEIIGFIPTSENEIPFTVYRAKAQESIMFEKLFQR